MLRRLIVQWYSISCCQLSLAITIPESCWPLNHGSATAISCSQEPISKVTWPAISHLTIHTEHALRRVSTWNGWDDLSKKKGRKWINKNHSSLNTLKSTTFQGVTPSSMPGKLQQKISSTCLVGRYLRHAPPASNPRILRSCLLVQPYLDADLWEQDRWRSQYFSSHV